jgi:hypothetical protein
VGADSIKTGQVDARSLLALVKPPIDGWFGLFCAVRSALRVKSPKKRPPGARCHFAALKRLTRIC